MANVKLNNKIVEIDKIVSFGCSFTAGDELLDYLIHPNADQIKTEKGILHWKEKYKYMPMTNETKEKEQQLSWAGQVAKKLNLHFTGRARGGASMMWSLLELERAILNNEITPTTLVLFGTTTKERGIYFNKHLPSPKSILFNWQEFWPNPKWHPDTVLELNDDGVLIHNHILCLYRLLQLSEQLEGRLKVCNIVNTLKFGKEDYNMNIDDLSLMQYRYKEICNNNNYFNDTSLVELCKSENDKHGGNHPKVHIHEKFADYVVSKLK